MASTTDNALASLKALLDSSETRSKEFVSNHLAVVAATFKESSPDDIIVMGRSCAHQLKQVFQAFNSDRVRIAIIDCVITLTKCLNAPGKIDAELFNQLSSDFLGLTLRYLASARVTTPEKQFVFDITSRYTEMLDCFMSGQGGRSFAANLGDTELQQVLAIARQIPLIAHFEAQRNLLRVFVRLIRNLKKTSANCSEITAQITEALMPHLTSALNILVPNAKDFTKVAEDALTSKATFDAVEAAYPGHGLQAFEISDVLGSVDGVMARSESFVFPDDARAVGIENALNRVYVSLAGVFVVGGDLDRDGASERFAWACVENVAFDAAALSVQLDFNTIGSVLQLHVFDNEMFNDLRRSIIGYRGPTTALWDILKSGTGRGKSKQTKNVAIEEPRHDRVIAAWDACAEAARKARAEQQQRLSTTATPAAAAAEAQAQLEVDESVALNAAINADALQLNTQAGSQAMAAIANAGAPKCSKSEDIRIGGVRSGGGSAAAAAELPTIDTLAQPQKIVAARDATTVKQQQQQQQQQASAPAAAGAATEAGSGADKSSKKGSSREHTTGAQAAAASAEAAPQKAPVSLKPRSSSSTSAAVSVPAPADDGGAEAAGASSQTGARLTSLRARSAGVNYAEAEHDSEGEEIAPQPAKAASQPKAKQLQLQQQQQQQRAKDTPEMRREIIREMTSPSAAATQNNRQQQQQQPKLSQLTTKKFAPSMQSENPRSGAAKSSAAEQAKEEKEEEETFCLENPTETEATASFKSKSKSTKKSTASTVAAVPVKSLQAAPAPLFAELEVVSASQRKFAPAAQTKTSAPQQAAAERQKKESAAAAAAAAAVAAAVAGAVVEETRERQQQSQKQLQQQQSKQSQSQQLPQLSRKRKQPSTTGAAETDAETAHQQKQDAQYASKFAFGDEPSLPSSSHGSSSSGSSSSVSGAPSSSKYKFLPDPNDMEVEGAESSAARASPSTLSSGKKPRKSSIAEDDYSASPGGAGQSNSSPMARRRSTGSAGAAAVAARMESFSAPSASLNSSGGDGTTFAVSSSGGISAAAKFSFLPDSQEASESPGHRGSSSGAAAAATTAKGRGRSAAESMVGSTSGSGDIAAQLLRGITALVSIVAEKPRGSALRDIGEEMLKHAPRVLDAQRTALQKALTARKDAAVAAVAKAASSSDVRAAEAQVDEGLQNAQSAISAAADKLFARIARAEAVADKAQSHVIALVADVKDSLVSAETLLNSIESTAGSRESVLGRVTAEAARILTEARETQRNAARAGTPGAGLRKSGGGSRAAAAGAASAASNKRKGQGASASSCLDPAYLASLIA